MVTVVPVVMPVVSVVLFRLILTFLRAWWILQIIDSVPLVLEGNATITCAATLLLLLLLLLLRDSMLSRLH